MFEKKKKMTTNATIVFFCDGVAEKKVMLPSFLYLRRRRRQ